MISRASSSECFVYITLPGQVSPVTAGRYELTKNARSDALGRFVYGRSYLENPDAVEIDPVELKLSTRTYETAQLRGVFGGLRDAGPDYWGRRVIEKHAGKTQLGELDYLLESPDDRAGALGFGLNRCPARSPAEIQQDDRPGKASDPRCRAGRRRDSERSRSAAGPGPAAARHVNGRRAPENRRAGQRRIVAGKIQPRRTTAGTIRGSNTPCCGLPANADLRLRKAGSKQSPDKDVLLVKRFDREKTAKGYTRARMVSGLTILRADEAPEARQNWSYVILVEELRRIVEDAKRDARELFRRVCFNALISNLDDHPRNHAIIAKEKNWKLSPAYDLTPSVPVSVERRDLALDCGDQGRYANAKNILSQHARFLLDKGEGEKIINDMKAQVEATWYETLRASGVSEKDGDTIRGAFVYPGFSL